MKHWTYIVPRSYHTLSVLSLGKIRLESRSDTVTNKISKFVHSSILSTHVSASHVIGTLAVIGSVLDKDPPIPLYILSYKYTEYVPPLQFFNLLKVPTPVKN